MTSRIEQMLFVNASKLPASELRYVAWLDVMGVRSIMSRSLSMSANFIFKFHSAALDEKVSGVELFPVMDGLYAVSADQDVIRQFLRGALARLAFTFSAEKEMRYRFVVRGALAYGTVIRGADVVKAAVPTIAGNSEYASTLLLGMPVIQAHIGESEAPPYGIFVSESARGFAPKGSGPFVEVWWRWYDSAHVNLATKLRGCLDEYYEWASAHSFPLLYEPARIQVHREMARQFFPAP